MTTPSIVQQSRTVLGAVTSGNATFASNVSVGSTVILINQSGSATPPQAISGVTGCGCSNWAQLESDVNFGEFDIWYATNSAGGSLTAAITYQSAETASNETWLFEIENAGAVTASLTDYTGATQSAFATTLNGVTPNSLLISSAKASANALTVPTGYTLLTSSNTAHGFATDNSLAAGGNTTVSWAVSPNDNGVAVLIAVAPQPSVTSVSPSSGSSAGGTSTTITGAGFTGVTAVHYGATAASFTFNSDTSISATSPAESAGTVDITVTTPSGTSGTSSSDHFTFSSSYLIPLELQQALNILAYGSYPPANGVKDAQKAANDWAGTTNLDLLAALNCKFYGTTTPLPGVHFPLDLNLVCNKLAGTTNLEAQHALNILANGGPE